MTVEELARLVRDMRNAQRAFFKTRDHRLIDASKALERQVDVTVEGILSSQGSMLEDMKHG